MTFKLQPLLDCSAFFGVMRFESLSLGCLCWSEGLGLGSGCFFTFFLFFFYSGRTPFSVPGQGSGKTPLSEAQGCRFFVVVQFRPADALLSTDPGNDQGTLFAHDVVQGYVLACVSFLTFLHVVYCYTFFSGQTLSPIAGLYVRPPAAIPGICRLFA